MGWFTDTKKSPAKKPVPLYELACPNCSNYMLSAGTNKELAICLKCHAEYSGDYVQACIALTPTEPTAPNQLDALVNDIKTAESVAWHKKISEMGLPTFKDIGYTPAPDLYYRCEALGGYQLGPKKLGYGDVVRVMVESWSHQHIKQHPAAFTLLVGGTGPHVIPSFEHDQLAEYEKSLYPAPPLIKIKDQNGLITVPPDKPSLPTQHFCANQKCRMHKHMVLPGIKWGIKSPHPDTFAFVTDDHMMNFTLEHGLDHAKVIGRCEFWTDVGGMSVHDFLCSDCMEAVSTIQHGEYLLHAEDKGDVPFCFNPRCRLHDKLVNPEVEFFKEQEVAALPKSGSVQAFAAEYPVSSKIIIHTAHVWFKVDGYDGEFTPTGAIPKGLLDAGPGKLRYQRYCGCCFEALQMYGVD